jgi:tricorn protease
VQHERDLVDKLSGGRLAYMHVKAMDRPSELKFKEEFVSQATGKDGLLVDVRYNGGGNVAHRLLDLLRKKPYVSFRPRGLGKTVAADWLGDYLWGKPTALLINQDSASNSEMMAEGFRALNIGPTVGVPTMGAVIATGSWSFIDGGTIRTPSSGVYGATGEDLELHGRQPDALVPYDPMAIKEGRDPQLEKAVQLLLAKQPSVAKTSTEK